MRSAVRFTLGCVLAIFSSSARPAMAQNGEPLGLDSVLASIDRHYPLIDAARRDVQAADAELMSARGAFDPAVRVRADGAPVGYYQNGRVDVMLEAPTPAWGTTLFTGYRASFGKFPIYDGKYETNQYGELRVGVSVPLIRNGPTDRRRVGITKAELGVPLSSAGVKQARIEAARIGAFRYWEWVAAGQRMRVAKELLTLAQKRDQAMVDRVHAGDLARIDRVDNHRAVLNRQGNVVAAKRSMQAAAIELSIYLRDEKGTPIVVGDDRLPPSFPQLDAVADEQDVMRRGRDTSLALKNRPELERLRLQREQLRVERDLAKNQGLPAIDIVAMVSQDFGPGSPTREPTVIEGGVSVDIPTLNRVARGRRLVAEANMARLDAQARLAADRIGAEVADALSALAASRERVRVAREEIALAHEVEEAERTRFSLGDSNILTVNLREQASAEASLREIDAQLDNQRAQAAYRAALAAE